MQSLNIEDQKGFMNRLLLSDDFDAFLVSSAELFTFTAIRFDGSFYRDYFSDIEKNDLPGDDPDSLPWKYLRPVFLSLIRGKNPPLRFSIVFRLAGHNVKKLLSQTGVRLSPVDISGLFLTIRFDGKNMTAVTGSSIRIFTADRSLDRAWDEMVRRFFASLKIAVEKRA